MQVWRWSTKWSRAKANRVFPREHTGHSNHPLPTTQETMQHMDINRWSNRNQIAYILCSQRWRRFIQSWAPKSLQMVTAAIKLSHLLLGRKLGSILKSRDITLLTKIRLVKAIVFPVVMYGCESWTMKKAEHQRNGVFWTVVLEKTLESPLNCKEIQPVHPKGNQSWIFIGRTDAEAEAPNLCPPDVKNWFIGKDPDVGKDWRREEKGTTEDEMVRWHHQFDGHEFEQALRVGDGQGSLVCCSPWGCKESDMTEWLNWTDWI